MWPFDYAHKNKKIEELETTVNNLYARVREVEAKEVKKNKILKTIEYKTVVKDIGQTTVKFTFVDGREFYSTFYGSYSQAAIPVDYGIGPWVDDLIVSNSLFAAHEAMKNINGDFSYTALDDMRSCKSMATGKVVSAEITRTEPFEEECQLAYIEEKEVEE